MIRIHDVPKTLIYAHGPWANMWSGRKLPFGVMRWRVAFIFNKWSQEGDIYNTQKPQPPKTPKPLETPIKEVSEWM